MAFTLPNPPIWQQNRKYSARHDRTFADVLFTEGVLDPGSGALLVTQNSLGLDNSVDVAAGLGIIQGDDELNQGKYLVRLENTRNIAFGPAPVSNARIDLVVLRVNDSTAGSTATPVDVSRIEVIQGVVDASPVTPAVPNTAIPLAQVLRTNGDVVIDNSMITDLRPTSTEQNFTVNSRFEALTTAQRNALTPFIGQTIFNTDTNEIQFWDGLVWVTVGTTFFQALTTAQRDLLTPFVGQTIFNTDVNQIQYWDGSNWLAPTSLGALSDVDLSGLSDADILRYDNSSGNWIATPLPDPIDLIIALS
jgi:hypothetical protein